VRLECASLPELAQPTSVLLVGWEGPVNEVQVKVLKTQVLQGFLAGGTYFGLLNKQRMPKQHQPQPHKKLGMPNKLTPRIRHIVHASAALVVAVSLYLGVLRVPQLRSHKHIAPWDLAFIIAQALGEGTTDLSLVAVDGGAIDVAVACFDGSGYGCGDLSLSKRAWRKCDFATRCVCSGDHPTHVQAWTSKCPDPLEAS